MMLKKLGIQMICVFLISSQILWGAGIHTQKWLIVSAADAIAPILIQMDSEREIVCHKINELNSNEFFDRALIANAVARVEQEALNNALVGGAPTFIGIALWFALKSILTSYDQIATPANIACWSGILFWEKGLYKALLHLFKHPYFYVKRKAYNKGLEAIFFERLESNGVTIEMINRLILRFNNTLDRLETYLLEDQLNHGARAQVLKSFKEKLPQSLTKNKNTKKISTTSLADFIVAHNAFAELMKNLEIDLDDLASSSGSIHSISATKEVLSKLDKTDDETLLMLKILGVEIFASQLYELISQVEKENVKVKIEIKVTDKIQPSQHVPLGLKKIRVKFTAKSNSKKGKITVTDSTEVAVPLMKENDLYHNTQFKSGLVVAIDKAVAVLNEKINESILKNCDPLLASAIDPIQSGEHNDEGPRVTQRKVLE